MKLFKTNNLAMEVKENQIRILEQDLLQEKHSSSLKENTISRLTKSIEDKDQRISELWVEKAELSLQNNQYFKTINKAADENIKLKKEIERLKNGFKAELDTIMINITQKEHETGFNELAESVCSNLTRINGKKPYKEHVCTIGCFGKHVIKAIQKDYDSINPKYKKGKQASADFLQHWYNRLKKEYDWIDYLYAVDGHIYFKSIF